MAGQQVSERTVQDVSAELRRFDSPAFPEIERVRLDDHLEVIAIHVNPDPSAPYRYRGTAYRRVRNTTQTMPAEEYNRILFQRLHNERRWENQPADGWSIDDLDVAEIRNTVVEAVRVGRLNEPGTREPEALLRGLGLIPDGVLFRAVAPSDSRCTTIGWT